MATRNLLIRGGADFSAMQNGLRQAQNSLQNFQTNVGRTMSKVGTILGSLAVGGLIKSATSMAMGVESAVNTINRNMGSAAQSFQDFVNTQSQALGMATADAYKYGSTFSNLLASFSSSAQDTADKTTELMKSAAVIASSTGRSYEDVAERIRSGMLGSTEAIEDLGIYTNIAMIESTNAFKQFANGKSWNQLDFQIQQQIRLAAILEQTYARYGDTIADTVQGRQAQLVASLKNVQLSLGQAFMPIYNAVLPGLIAMANAIGRVVSFIAQFTQAIFGVKQAQAQAAVPQQASAVGDLGKEYKKTGKEAKKAAASVAGFDEINSLADSSSGSGSDPSDGLGGGAGAIPDLGEGGFITGAMEISKKAKEMADKVRGVFSNLKTFFVTYKAEITAIMAGIAAALAFAFIATNWSTIIGGISAAFLALSKSAKGAWAAITGPIGLIAIAVAALVAAFVYFYQTNEKFKGVVDGIFTTIKNVMVDLWNNVLVPLGAWLADIFVASWKAVEDVLGLLWKNVLVPVAGFLAGVFLSAWEGIKDALVVLKTEVLQPLGDYFILFWQEIIVPLSAVLVDVLSAAFDLVSTAAKGLWENVLVPLGKFFAEAFGPTVEAITAVLTFLWKSVFVPLGTFLGVAFFLVWKALVEIIEFLWHNVLEPLIPFLKGTLKVAFEVIGSTIDGLKTTFIGLMEFITGVFTGDWAKAWNGVKDIFKGVFDSLYGIVKTPLNLIIGIINEVIDGLNSISITLPEWSPIGGGQSFGVSIPKIPKLARGGIVDGATNFGNYIAGEAGAEMIVPLENTPFVDKLAGALGTAVMSAMQFSGNNSESGDIVLQLDGTTLGRVIGPLLDKERQRVGNSMIVKTT